MKVINPPLPLYLFLEHFYQLLQQHKQLILSLEIPLRPLLVTPIFILSVIKKKEDVIDLTDGAAIGILISHNSA